MRGQSGYALVLETRSILTSKLLYLFQAQTGPSRCLASVCGHPLSYLAVHSKADPFFCLQISVLLLDILHMLLIQNTVVICKFNPVLDYLGPYAECAPSTRPHIPQDGSLQSACVEYSVGVSNDYIRSQESHKRVGRSCSLWSKLAMFLLPTGEQSRANFSATTSS